MKSILYERLLESSGSPKYGKNRGDIETKIYDFYHDENAVNHFDPNDDDPQRRHHYDDEDQRELDALADSGEFASGDSNMDTDNAWESEGRYHQRIEYDKRKRNYGAGTAYKGKDNTNVFVDDATKAADNDYEDELERASTAKDYFTPQRYAKGARMHSVRHPGSARPELVDYDPDSDPKAKWYD